MLKEKIDNTVENIPNFPELGIQYKDITPIFLNQELCTEITDAFAKHSKGKVDIVCGIESRGFLFGVQIANKLGVPFVMIRKSGKLPPPVISEKYDLEYGSSQIEVKEGHIKEGQRVLIHDDILATGGTAEACAKLVIKCKATVSQFSFIAKLEGLGGEEKLIDFSKDMYTLTEY